MAPHIIRDIDTKMTYRMTNYDVKMGHKFMMWFRLLFILVEIFPVSSISAQIVQPRNLGSTLVASTQATEQVQWRVRSNGVRIRFLPNQSMMLPAVT